MRLSWRQLTAELADLVPSLSETLIQLMRRWQIDLDLAVNTRVQTVVLCDEIENATRTISVRRSPAAARKRSITFGPLWPVNRLNVARQEGGKERTPLEQINRRGHPIREAGE